MGRPPKSTRGWRGGNTNPRKRGLGITKRNMRGKGGCAVLIGVGGSVITAVMMLGHKLGIVAYGLLLASN